MPKDGENVGLIIGSEIVACPYAEALPKLVQTLSDLMSGGARAMEAAQTQTQIEDIFLASQRKNSTSNGSDAQRFIGILIGGSVSNASDIYFV